jgi:hypothetical protein
VGAAAALLDEEVREPEQRLRTEERPLTSRMLITAKQAGAGGLANAARLDIEEQIEFPRSKRAALELSGNNLLKQRVKLGNQD